MPSFRIPPPLRHSGHSSTQPQPPITSRDRRLQAFLDVTFDVLYDWNIETGAIAFTDRIDEMLGLPAGGFPRNIEGWLERIHLDDHDSTMEALSTSILGNTLFSCEYRLRRGDGSWATVTDQGVLLTGRGGRATNMIGAIRDVTRERAAQAVRREADELRRVLFGLPSPAMQVDESGAYVDADEHALAFFRRTRDEMLARHVADDFPAVVVEAITGGDAPGSGELEVSCDVRGTARSTCCSASCLRASPEAGAASSLVRTSPNRRRCRRRWRARNGRCGARRRSSTSATRRSRSFWSSASRTSGSSNNGSSPTSTSSSSRRWSASAAPCAIVRSGSRSTPCARTCARSWARSVSAWRRAAHPARPLTRREREVADLVRHGRTSAEIAEALHVSRAAVAFHRANIRRKLGIPKHGPRLTTHLESMTRD